MDCDICKKDSKWCEMIGPSFICHKCINKNKVMGLILRTHTDTFRSIIKKFKIRNYEELIKIKREEIEEKINLKKYGI